MNGYWSKYKTEGFSADKGNKRSRTRQFFTLPDLPNKMLRINLLSGAVFAFSLLVLLRLFLLQGKEHHRWLQIAERQHESSVQIQGVRGNILDRSGRTLAASVKAVSLGAHPNEIEDKQTAAKTLGAVLKTDSKEIFKKLEVDKPFVWLARGLSIDAKEVLDKEKIPGIAQIQEYKRFYPQGQIAGLILGKVSREGRGLSGIELAYNEQLMAASTDYSVRRDARGKLLSAASADSESKPFSYSLKHIAAIDMGPLFYSYEDTAHAVQLRKEGAPLELSIDAVAQSIVEEELARARVDSQARRVFAAVMAAETGEILAMAQNPGWDPNNFETAGNEELRNSVTQDAFEPGSTLKPLVAAFALDENVVKEKEMLDCENGEYRVGPHVIRDVHPEGVISFSDVLVRSSNICMAKLGQRLGASRLHAALGDLGLGKRIDIELKGASVGILRSLKEWAEVDVATHSFGQGVSVTALQLMRAYSALANGGIMVEPTLLKETALKGNGRKGERVFRQFAAQTVADILRGVTEDEHGTARKAAIPGLIVQGKTGTAQKVRAGSRGYDPDKVLASFIGFVDGRQIGLNTTLIMFVGVDEPEVRPRWGGTLAAPVFQRAMSRIFSHLLSIQPNRTLTTAALERPGLNSSTNS